MTGKGEVVGGGRGQCWGLTLDAACRERVLRRCSVLCPPHFLPPVLCLPAHLPLPPGLLALGHCGSSTYGQASQGLSH